APAFGQGHGCRESGRAILKPQEHRVGQRADAARRQARQTAVRQYRIQINKGKNFSILSLPLGRKPGVVRPFGFGPVQGVTRECNQKIMSFLISWPQSLRAPAKWPKYWPGSSGAGKPLANPVRSGRKQP